MFPMISLLIGHNNFMWLLGADEATSNYLNQWWLTTWHHLTKIHSNFFRYLWCNTAVSPLLTHWRYRSLALNHEFFYSHLSCEGFLFSPPHVPSNGPEVIPTLSRPITDPHASTGTPSFHRRRMRRPAHLSVPVPMGMARSSSAPDVRRLSPDLPMMRWGAEATSL